MIWSKFAKMPIFSLNFLAKLFFKIITSVLGVIYGSLA
jgi:hypothetical protein